MEIINHMKTVIVMYLRKMKFLWISQFCCIRIIKIALYETYYDKLQTYFGQENIQLHYFYTDAFTLSVNTNDIIRHLKNLEDIFDFNTLDKNHELFSNKNRKVFGKIKIKTPKSIWID